MTYANDPIVGPNGEILGHLNSALLQRQQVTAEQHTALLLSHQLKHVLFAGAKDVLTEPKTEGRSIKLRLLAKMFSTLETEQQRLWNFPLDTSYHRFFDFPGCSCPKLDNAERLGSGFVIRATDCEIHGGEIARPPTAEQKAIADLLTSYRMLAERVGSTAYSFNELPSVKAAKKLL